MGSSTLTIEAVERIWPPGAPRDGIWRLHESVERLAVPGLRDHGSNPCLAAVLSEYLPDHSLVALSAKAQGEIARSHICKKADREISLLATALPR